MLLAPDHFMFVRAGAGKGPEALNNVDPDSFHGGGDAHAVPFVADIFPFAVAGTLSHEVFKRGALTLPGEHQNPLRRRSRSVL